MSEQINDGGPAFYSVTCINGDNYNAPRLVHHRGMSLRDWFAGQALAGLLGNSEFKTDADAESQIPGAIARYCYEAADAMLERRKK